MKTTVLKEIMAFLFGRKYYANIVNVKGTVDCELCCYIFSTKEEVEKHRLTLSTSMTYTFVETVSFRSHNIYVDGSKKLNR